MYLISKALENILNTSNSIKSKSKIIVDGNEYTSIIKTTPKCSHKNSTQFGGFPAKTCTFEVYNYENNLNFEGKEIYLYKGIEVNGNYEWILQGIFIPQAKNITTNLSNKTISFKDVQDRTQLFDVPYQTKLTYDSTTTHTGLEIIKEAADNLGLVLASEKFNLSDYSFKQPNFKQNITYREVINKFAEIAGCIAYITRDGKLIIKCKNDTGHIINRNRYITYSKEESITYNTVVFGKSGANDDIKYPEKMADEDRVTYKIDDNPFVDLYRQEMIADISTNIIGSTLIPFQLENFVDGFYLDLNDCISIVDRNGETTSVNILNYETASRIRSNISAELPEKTNVNYNLAGSNKQEIDEVRFDVDHIKKEIDLLNQKVVNLSATVTGINKLELTECSNTPLYKLIISGDDDLLFPNTKLFPGATTYLKNSFLYVNRGTDDETTYNLGITSLRTLGTIKDEFILENGKATLIKRIGLNDSLEKYVLDEPVIKDLGSLSVNIKEGNNTIELPSFPSFRLTATYLLKNQYTDTFATQASVTNQIKVAQDEILIESKSQILESGDELIASINTTSTGNVKIKASDTISLEGTVSANGNFKIDEKGNAIMTSAKITGGDITLPEGGKVVGGDGMMSVMIVNASIWSSQFLGGQGFMPMGFEGISSQGYAISQMIDFVIPENFKPRKAFIYLKHIPLTSKGYFDTQTEQSYTGYARNVKAYLCSDGSSSRSINYSIGPPTIEGNYTEIPKAFGVNGFTGSATELKEKTSIDISNYIKNPGTYSIQLKSSMAVPTAYKTIYEATGCLLAQLYIYGYTSEQIE